MTTSAESIDFGPGTARAPRRPLGVEWIHGSVSAKHNTDPDLQVHWYDEHTVVLRQNKAIDYEAPFLFLLFGADRAVLVDTGATESPELFPLRGTIDGLVSEWLERHPRDDYGLVVLHSHSHHDHVAGDGQLRDRPDTTVVNAPVRTSTTTSGSPPTWTDRPGSTWAGGRWTASRARATTLRPSRSTTGSRGSC